MTNTLKGKDMLALSDWSKSELDQILDLAFRFKKMGAASHSLDILKGKGLLLLWFRRSTRTWNSFTWGMQQLGGFVQSRDSKDMWLRLEEEAGGGSGESLQDTALVLDRYVDALGIRLVDLTPDQVGGRIPQWGDAHAIFRKFAEYMKAPVINMACDLHHPTQSMADIMVLKEKLGDVRDKKVVTMWAYTPRAQSWSAGQGLALVSSIYGANVTVASPEGYNLDPRVMSVVEKECAKNGTKFEVSHNLKSALEGADAIYPRNWRTQFYVDAEGKEAERLRHRGGATACLLLLRLLQGPSQQVDEREGMAWCRLDI